ncbi:MAG: hypothetical protein VYB34_07570 [Planctomycetota bacterium]|nr:hypothetical protein [Planctomycetota bacterium]MEE3053582.1 hypothetical protein [Planctomycetota bacterium]|tara:strand:- start:2 stop:595 length:594 start_codon:yes stop_codon:yes gene_type:complete
MEKKIIPIALFDMDGTLADYVSAMKRDMESMRGPREPEADENELWNDPEPHIKARKDIIEKKPGWWRDLEPMKTGMEVVKIARELGFEIRVLTKGPNDVPYAWAEKLEWCQEHLGKDTQVTITRDKSTVYGRVLVDDYWPFMKGWLENRKHGLGLMPGDSDDKDVPHPNVTHYDDSNLDEVKKLLIRARDREDNEPF